MVYLCYLNISLLSLGNWVSKLIVNKLWSTWDHIYVHICTYMHIYAHICTWDLFKLINQTTAPSKTGIVFSDLCSDVTFCDPNFSDLGDFREDLVKKLYLKYHSEIIHLSLIWGKPKGNPKEQPCQPKENHVHPNSFTWIYILFKKGNFGDFLNFLNIDVWRSIMAKLLEYA